MTHADDGRTAPTRSDAGRGPANEREDVGERGSLTSRGSDVSDDGLEDHTACENNATHLTAVLDRVATPIPRINMHLRRVRSPDYFRTQYLSNLGIWANDRARRQMSAEPVETGVQPYTAAGKGHDGSSCHHPETSPAGKESDIQSSLSAANVTKSRGADGACRVSTNAVLVDADSVAEAHGVCTTEGEHAKKSRTLVRREERSEMGESVSETEDLTRHATSIGNLHKDMEASEKARARTKSERIQEEHAGIADKTLEGGSEGVSIERIENVDASNDRRGTLQSTGGHADEKTFPPCAENAPSDPGDITGTMIGTQREGTVQGVRLSSMDTEVVSGRAPGKSELKVLGLTKIIGANKVATTVSPLKDSRQSQGMPKSSRQTPSPRVVPVMMTVIQAERVQGESTIADDPMNNSSDEIIVGSNAIMTHDGVTIDLEHEAAESPQPGTLQHQSKNSPTLGSSTSAAVVQTTVDLATPALRPQIVKPRRRDIRRDYLTNLGMKRAVVAGPGGTRRPPMHRRSSFHDGSVSRPVAEQLKDPNSGDINFEDFIKAVGSLFGGGGSKKMNESRRCPKCEREKSRSCSPSPGRSSRGVGGKGWGGLRGKGSGDKSELEDGGTEPAMVTATPCRHKHVEFAPLVSAVYIPVHSEYSNRVRRSYWNSAVEIREMVYRNMIEFDAEEYNWKNVAEEEDMYYCHETGEFIHPIFFEEPVAEKQEEPCSVEQKEERVEFVNRGRELPIMQRP